MAYFSYSFLIYLSISWLIMCSEKKHEVLSRLAHAAQSARKTEKVKAAEEEIINHLVEENQKRSLLISNISPNRIVKTSLDGKNLIWLELRTRKLYYFHNGKKSKMTLSLKENTQIADFNPSWNGNYIVFVLRKDKKCTPVVFSFLEQRTLETNLPETECHNTPVLSDDGHVLHYTANNGELLRQTLVHRTLKAPSPLIESISFPRKNFVAKYSKIKSRFILYPVGPHAILLLFGNAGYYRLYSYDGVGDKLKKHNLIASTGKIFFSPNTAQKKNLSGKKISENTRLGLDNASAFIYSGGAGKHKLHALRWEGTKVKIGHGFTAPIFTNLVFLRKQNAFLGIQNNDLYLWNPASQSNKEKTQKVPLSAKSLFQFNEGLFYTDLSNRIYFYERPFSSFETALIGLYAKISSLESEEE